MATTARITITAAPGFTITNGTVLTLVVTPGGSTVFPAVGSGSFPNSGASAISNFITLTPSITAGSKTVQVTGWSTTSFSPSLTPGDTGGSVTVRFNDVPSTTSPSSNISRPGLPSAVTSPAVNVNVRCIHGSSLIETKNGLKRIDSFGPEEEVLSGKNFDEYVKASLIYCPLTFEGVDHDALIFEPGSLGENEPSKKLIIDPGHPICRKSEYLEKGSEALRPAGEFYEELMVRSSYKGSDKVCVKKWTDVFVQSEPSMRYDLLLSEGYDSYIANGMVVRSTGYKDHRYGEFV